MGLDYQELRYVVFEIFLSKDSSFILIVYVLRYCSLHYINCSMVANGLAEVYCSLLVVVHSLTEMQMLFLKLLAQIQDGSGLVHPYVYRCFFALF